MELRYLTLIALVFMLIACLSASVTYHKKRPIIEKYLTFFLWGTFLVEVTSAILSRVYSIQTYLMYNVYMLVSILFYLYWYHALIIDKLGKRLIIVFAALFILMGGYNFLNSDDGGLNKYTFLLGAVFTLTCTFLHFRQLLQSNDVLRVSRTLPFWVSTGLLLFNIGIVPFMLLSDYFDFRDNVYYIMIILILNFILYGCYSIGFIWSSKKHNRF